MIKSKKCKECDRPAFSKGLCQIHSKNTSIKSGNKSIKISRPKTTEKKKEQQEKRAIYFDYHIERCKYSEFSGLPIDEPTRANICHIFSKSQHPSLEDNLENHVYLTLNEHQDFDRLLLACQFKDIEETFGENNANKIWLIAKKLLPLCLENTKFKRELEKYLYERDIKG